MLTLEPQVRLCISPRGGWWSACARFGLQGYARRRPLHGFLTGTLGKVAAQRRPRVRHRPCSLPSTRRGAGSSGSRTQPRPPFSAAASWCRMCCGRQWAAAVGGVSTPRPATGKAARMWSARKIFISYRRNDTASAALAHAIVQILSSEFGRRNVFIDVDMAAGTAFREMLDKRLAECKVLLALIGPGWLKAQDDTGRPRLDDPDDWVRLEIAKALNRNITVIPVRVNGTELPNEAELPENSCNS
jgi:hypothetical protein